MGGTCEGATGGCRPSLRPSSGRTRRGFGRYGRTCRILSSPSGGTECSRFNFTKISPGCNTNTNKCNNGNFKFSNSVSLNSVFSSFFNKNNNFNNFNNEGPGTPRQNESVRVSVGVAFRRTTGNYGGAIRIPEIRSYDRYNNDNTTGNSRTGAYPSYNNGNCIGIRGEVNFAIISSRHRYAGYNNHNGVVSGPYPGYNNGNGMEHEGGVRISIPTNVDRSEVLAVHNLNSDNFGNNPTNSLGVVMGVGGRPCFAHRNCGI